MWTFTGYPPSICAMTVILLMKFGSQTNLLIWLTWLFPLACWLLNQVKVISEMSSLLADQVWQLLTVNIRSYHSPLACWLLQVGMILEMSSSMAGLVSYNVGACRMIPEVPTGEEKVSWDCSCICLCIHLYLYLHLFDPGGQETRQEYS